MGKQKSSSLISLFYPLLCLLKLRIFPSLALIRIAFYWTDVVFIEAATLSRRSFPECLATATVMNSSVCVRVLEKTNNGTFSSWVTTVDICTLSSLFQRDEHRHQSPSLLLLPC